ncbi:hypothetical protein COW53_02685 [bacterium CG17_big_fil_post_rev_8_21_14_2_50_64_8]|nr:MAG: hypothetical protein COW53_02685 [bacterium CG17_big_fil_post_rev_8_21_14_2_50_64_8]
MSQSARLPEAWNGCPRCRGINAHLSWNTHKGSEIVNDHNRFSIETMGDPAYPLVLLRRVIAISLETVRIVNALPPLRLTKDGQR